MVGQMSNFGDFSEKMTFFNFESRYGKKYKDSDMEPPLACSPGHSLLENMNLEAAAPLLLLHTYGLGNRKVTKAARQRRRAAGRYGLQEFTVAHTTHVWAQVALCCI